MASGVELGVINAAAPSGAAAVPASAIVEPAVVESVAVVPGLEGSDTSEAAPPSTAVVVSEASAVVAVESSTVESQVPATVSIPTDEELDAVQLDASKLQVYQVALELHSLCATLVALMNRIVKDQLERASLSVVLNIAEGGGRRSRRARRAITRSRVAARPRWRR